MKIFTLTNKEKITMISDFLEPKDKYQTFKEGDEIFSGGVISGVSGKKLHITTKSGRDRIIINDSHNNIFTSLKEQGLEIHLNDDTLFSIDEYLNCKKVDIILNYPAEIISVKKGVQIRNMFLYTYQKLSIQETDLEFVGCYINSGQIETFDKLPKTTNTKMRVRYCLEFWMKKNMFPKDVDATNEEFMNRIFEKFGFNQKIIDAHEIYVYTGNYSKHLDYFYTKENGKWRYKGN